MEAVWNEVKAVIKKSIPDHSYRMWIEPIKPSQGEDDSLVLACPNCFSKKRVQEHFSAIIESERAGQKMPFFDRGRPVQR